MFNATKAKNINFEINCKLNKEIDLEYAFYYSDITSVPKINNAKPSNISNMFGYCKWIKYYPDDMDTWFDWSKIDSLENGYPLVSVRDIFVANSRLRKIPMGMLKHCDCKAPSYLGGWDFHLLYSLDEIKDLPNPYYKSTFSSNIILGTTSLEHIKDFTFASTMTNGEPNNPNWSYLDLDLTHAGYGNHLIYMDFTNDLKIIDEIGYQRLKNNPDAWTELQEYSRYNHDSAVRTINSLPDTSAFIASNGGTNTIKFAGANGSKTDGGAISTLTPEEIAVATAKGWTVSLV